MAYRLFTILITSCAPLGMYLSKKDHLTAIKVIFLNVSERRDKKNIKRKLSCEQDNIYRIRQLMVESGRKDGEEEDYAPLAELETFVSFYKV